MTQTSHSTFAAFVGIDWADAKHDICLQATGTAKRECFQLEHTPEAIDAWVTSSTLKVGLSSVDGNQLCAMGHVCLDSRC